MKLISKSVADTIKIGKIIANNAREGDIVCLFGDLGSGKTVLVKGIAQGLGAAVDKIISPSFVLMRQYTRTRVPLYHFDLYRLRETRDILTLGYEDYLYGRGVAVIEWAERLACLLPKEFLRIELTVLDDRKRLLKILAVGRRYQELAKKIAGIDSFGRNH